jgi:hypothetical protein
MACLSRCDCDSGSPFAELAFEAIYSSTNDRWEGSIEFPGCEATLNFRITCEDTIDDEGDIDDDWYWSDDGCTGDWSDPVPASEADNCGCVPFALTHTIGGSDDYLTGCCPDYTAPDYPQLTIFLYCTEEDRDTLRCDP